MRTYKQMRKKFYADSPFDLKSLLNKRYKKIVDEVIHEAVSTGNRDTEKEIKFDIKSRMKSALLIKDKIKGV